MDEVGDSRDALARAVAGAMIGGEGTAASWGMRLEDVGPGRARVLMVVRPDMLNGHGTAHGGMIFALADSAFAYACNAANETTVGQHASIAFLSPATAGERLVATANAGAEAGRSGVCAVAVSAGDGRAVAQCQGVSRRVGGPIAREKNDD